MGGILKNNNDNFIELLKGSSISFFLKVLGMIFGYLVMVFITKFYGAEEWGIYSLCITMLSMSILIPKFGFDNSLLRIVTELYNINKKEQIFYVIIKATMISILLSCIIVIIINTFSDLLVYRVLKNPEMKSYLKLVSYGVLPMTVLTIVSSTFQALKKVAQFVLFQTTAINIIFLLLLILSRWNGNPLTPFNIYILTVLLVLGISIIFLIRCFKKNEIKLWITRNVRYGYKSIISISYPMLLANSFAVLMGWSDILMLSYYKSNVDIGIYNSALKLALLSTIPLIAINSIAAPKFVEFYAKKDFEGLKDTVQKSTKMIFYTSAPILIVLIFFSKTILGFLGSDFQVGYIALVYLCLSRFINAISGSVGYLMQMTDYQKTFQNVLIIAFLINIILNFILIPKYSYTGAAIASSLAMTFWNLVLVLLIKKKFGFWTIYNPLKVR